MTDREVTDRKARIVNRATPKTLDISQHVINKSASRHDMGFNVVGEFEMQLSKDCKSAVNLKPFF